MQKSFVVPLVLCPFGFRRAFHEMPLLHEMPYAGTIQGMFKDRLARFWGVRVLYKG